MNNCYNFSGFEGSITNIDDKNLFYLLIKTTNNYTVFIIFYI